ncbi:hypothetical protein PF66_04229 [Pseudomonas asplenii]|uniref:Uncharacterized protein n=1 Tax=Pseudomonas asplenii TaxID=53407 RepID=A0A0N0VJ06_9PSED|nr:hypothetical protein [Pseudomonas fuscovaginae]KPA89377.1 hypothetical protein PF66_04229 [Pseudomonas fuscovaginae]
MFEGFLLVLTLAVPVVLSVFVVVSLFGVGESPVDRCKSIFVLDSEKGLINQGLLWLSILTPLFIAISLGMWVWPEYQVDLSLSGYKKFVEISLLSLGVVSISLPLTGLIARFHSTRQTARQIEVVSFKNNVDAFYTHRKEMLGYFSALGEVRYLDVITFSYRIHPVLHVRFFSGAPEKGFPKVKRDYFNYVENRILAASKFLNGLLRGEGGSIGLLNLYINACNDMYLASEALAIPEISNDLFLKGVQIKSKSEDYDCIILGTTTLEALAAIRYLKGYYDNLCDFAGVERMKIDEGYDVVFRGGQKLLDGKLYIEELHEFEIDQLVEDGRARYCDNHPLVLKGKERE